ncbi:glycosyltransferase [Trinickia acidisoli]|uniref:glycosyltransferase n=1 Tax=Trinickia acidisoli TaxID=2767482 RepID=UPI001A8DB06E|nr:glycosyltransferase [Trinickia acidisoli]
MSTYFGVRAEWLRASLSSLATQRLPPAQVVLVIDGEIPKDQEQAVESVRGSAPLIEWTILRQARKGLAAALNYGLTAAKYDLIARMDSDDICHPDRFEVQLKALAAEPAVDVICSWHAEFEVEGEVLATKRTPEFHGQIARYLNYRNIISHPTIVLRRDLLMSVGGYNESVGLLEDYDLYLKLLLRGAKYYCIQKPLVYVRISREQRNRRGGIGYIWTEVKFRTRALMARKISITGWVVGVMVYPIFRLSPPWLKGIFYAAVRSGQ